MPSHCVIMKGIGSLYLAGPPLVKVLFINFLAVLGEYGYITDPVFFKSVLKNFPECKIRLEFLKLNLEYSCRELGSYGAMGGVQYLNLISLSPSLTN